MGSPILISFCSPHNYAISHKLDSDEIIQVTDFSPILVYFKAHVNDFQFLNRWFWKHWQNFWRCKSQDGFDMNFVLKWFELLNSWIEEIEWFFTGLCYRVIMYNFEHKIHVKTCKCKLHLDCKIQHLNNWLLAVIKFYVRYIYITFCD